MADESGEEAQKRRESAPPLEFLKPGEAQAPMPPRDQPAAWVPRPDEYRPQAWPAPARPPPTAPNLPKIAGILLVLAGAVGMAGSIANAVILPTPAEYTTFVTNNSPSVLAVLQVCGLVSIWSQALAVLGGIMAFQRMNWKLTLVCAIFSLLTLGFFFFEASVLGLIGLIVVVRSRPYFNT